MHPITIRILVATFAAAALLSAQRASADMYTATQAYDKGDFAGAFQQFKDLAELGQPTAQLNLAIMFGRGKGVAANATYAHAWASLAAQNGEDRGKAIAEDLAASLTPTSLQVSSEIQAQYSQAKLNARLLPHVLNGREYADRDPPRPSKPYLPAYPLAAQNKGIQGETYVEYIVAPDGHPRLPRILYSLPTGYFEEYVRESVMRSTYLPARINGQPISTTMSMLYNFKMQSVSIHAYGDLQHRVEQARAKAEAGDVSAQMLYGMMIAGLPQLNQTYDKALPWFLKAAQAGVPMRNFKLARDC